MKRTLCTILAAALCLCLAAPRASAAQSPYFEIKVIDQETGRGIPLVQLETVSHDRFLTDSAGAVAFDEPGLMNRKVFFYLSSDGYSFPKDGFGYAGTALMSTPGTRATLKMKRLNIAERLYRITGEGIYRDTVLLGEKPPIREPLLNAQVSGQDGALMTQYRGKYYWFWGDTSRPSYPLGQFGTSCATSELPGNGGLDPSAGIDLTYLKGPDGFSRPMCPWDHAHPIWIDGLMVLPDQTGRERLLAHYSIIQSLDRNTETGLAIFNDDAGHFDKLKVFPPGNTWRAPRAHPVRITDHGITYFFFLMPEAAVRVPATMDAILDPANYESWSCLAPGTKFTSATNARLDRDAAGNLIYGWKKNTDPVCETEEAELIKAGRIKPSEARWQIADADTGAPVTFHYGSINWNPYLKKWLWLAVQAGGTSYLGEVWLAAADSPTGPWHTARKIVTHDHYSFYNPVQHPLFDQAGGRYIYFEGTYADTFSGTPSITPRYNYNQIMYRLDLADPRLRGL